MFEEVPRERRGIARLLARPVVLGPFVVGTGMLVAALGGSVAVATAATVITASAIGSTDLPARPGHPVIPAAASSSHLHAAATKRSSAHPAMPTASATPRPAPSDAAAPTQSGAGSGGNLVQTSSQEPPASALNGGSANPSSPASSSPVSGAASSAVASPAGSGPLGNALVYFTGYDPVSGRIAYQFATRQPDSAGSVLYRVSGSDSFTATVANSITITSGGTLCHPAGGSCTKNQLFDAAKSGFFAEVAVDAAGALRSVVEVGQLPPIAKLAPAPSAGASPGSGPQVPPANRQLAAPSGSPEDRSPTPEGSSAAS